MKSKFVEASKTLLIAMGVCVCAIIVAIIVVAIVKWMVSFIPLYVIYIILGVIMFCVVLWMVHVFRKDNTDIAQSVNVSNGIVDSNAVDRNEQKREIAHKIAWETSKHYDPLCCKEVWCEMAAMDAIDWADKNPPEKLKEKFVNEASLWLLEELKKHIYEEYVEFDIVYEFRKAMMGENYKRKK